MALSYLNRQFMSGAEQLRFIRPGKDKKQLFTNTFKTRFTPYNTTFLRTVKYNDCNKFIFALDCDNDVFDSFILGESKKIYNFIKRVIGVNPVLKASGNAGVQVFFNLLFDQALSYEDCLEGMKNLAYTIYKGTPFLELDIYHPSAKTDDSSPAFIDMSMFDKNRMIRSYSIHLKSGMFSVPFMPDDTLATVMAKKTKLYDTVSWIAPGTLKFDDIDYLEEWKESPGRGRNISIEALEGASLEGSGDVFGRLPVKLKQIVNVDAEAGCPHDYKWILEAWLRAVEGLSTDAIEKFIVENCRWRDFEANGSARYQIRYSCNSADRVGTEGRLLVPMSMLTKKEFRDGMVKLRKNYGIKEEKFQ